MHLDFDAHMNTDDKCRAHRLNQNGRLPDLHDGQLVYGHMIVSSTTSGDASKPRTDESRCFHVFTLDCSSAVETVEVIVIEIIVQNHIAHSINAQVMTLCSEITKH